MSNVCKNTYLESHVRFISRNKKRTIDTLPAKGSKRSRTTGTYRTEPFIANELSPTTLVSTDGDICNNGTGLRGYKRILNISPSTPVGLPRKHLFTESSPDLREINKKEDILMGGNEIDVQAAISEDTGYGRPTSRSKIKERKIIKVLKRRPTAVQVAQEDNKERKDEKPVPAQSIIKLKGFSIKNLKQQHRNYKTTKKKEKLSGNNDRPDPKQRLISNIYSRITTEHDKTGGDRDKEPLGQVKDPSDD